MLDVGTAQSCTATFCDRASSSRRGRRRRRTFRCPRRRFFRRRSCCPCPVRAHTVNARVAERKPAVREDLRRFHLPAPRAPPSYHRERHRGDGASLQRHRQREEKPKPGSSRSRLCSPRGRGACAKLARLLDTAHAPLVFLLTCIRASPEEFQIANHAAALPHRPRPRRREIIAGAPPRPAREAERPDPLDLLVFCRRSNCFLEFRSRSRFHGAAVALLNQIVAGTSLARAADVRPSLRRRSRRHARLEACGSSGTTREKRRALATSGRRRRVSTLEAGSEFRRGAGARSRRGYTACTSCADPEARAEREACRADLVSSQLRCRKPRAKSKLALEPHTSDRRIRGSSFGTPSLISASPPALEATSAGAG